MSLFNLFEQFPDNHTTITPSNTANLPVEMLVMAGTAGTIAVVDKNDNVVTYTVEAGMLLPVIAKRINSTNTTVSQVIGLY